ncbi:hypothetical protein FRC14_001991 [Serendipita sp. 396]|nr:hypothetical protein FRC14_001991 [Serendipita sp. 396]
MNGLLSQTQIARNAIASCSRTASVQPSCRGFATRRRVNDNHTLRSNNKTMVYKPFLLGIRRSFHSSTPTSKNPYKVLGVEKDASASDIKKAYFQLAKKYHPDTNKDTTSKERFLEIQNAYEILGDEQKRTAYDTYGETSQQPGFGQNPFAGNPFAGASGFTHNFSSGSSPMGDLFSSLFGGFDGGRPTSTRGDDIEASISISFMEGAKGTTRMVNVTPVADCEPCSATGLKSGARRQQCSTCRGTGSQTMVLNSGFQMSSTCGVCQGTGSSIPRGSECKDCGGVGKVKVRKQVKIDIPAGIEDGMTVRIPREGDASMSRKGSPGDLLVRVNVGSSDVFRRQGSNLYHDAVLPLHVAVLGGRVRVPTLDGEVELRVPTGTQPGDDVVLRGRGVQSAVVRGSKGDLFVSFLVNIPRNLTPRQRELMQQYADDVEGRRNTRTNPTPTSGTGSTTNRTSSDSSNGATTRSASSSATDSRPEQPGTDSTSSPSSRGTPTGTAGTDLNGSSGTRTDGKDANESETQGGNKSTSSPWKTLKGFIGLH